MIGYRGGFYEIDEATRAVLTGEPVSTELKRAVTDELDAIAALEGPDDAQKPETERRVRALCLNITFDCNMSCVYCFTRRRRPDSGPRSMNGETARSAVLFLFEHSLPKAPLQIDFFGGEPLLNLDVIRQTVKFARSQAGTERKVNFTLTTNGSLLDRETAAFLDGEKFQVILSLDGIAELHDRQRPFKDGSPSWNEVFSRIVEFLRLRDYENYYLRGTFTPQSCNLVETARHFMAHNLTNFSLEPARGSEKESWAVREKHLESIFQQYDHLARLVIDHYRQGSQVNFFHFNIFQDPPLCMARRLCGCGAAVEYLSIDAGGKIFPCHQLHGEERFFMGTVFDKKKSPHFEANYDLFLKSHLLNKRECRACWARYYCSGGCHANNHLVNGAIDRPDGLGCSLQKKRLECALWIKAQQKARQEELPPGEKESHHLHRIND